MGKNKKKMLERMRYETRSIPFTRKTIGNTLPVATIWKMALKGAARTTWALTAATWRE